MKQVRRRIQGLWMSGLCLLFLATCAPLDVHEGYGLLSLSISISSSELSVMRGGLYVKSPARGLVVVEGQRYNTEVAFAGASSIDNLKKSFDLDLNHSFRGRTRHRLSAMNGDPSALKALLAYESYRRGGFDVPGIEPVALWLNDEYVGLYLLLERYDEDYFRARNLDPTVVYKAQKTQANLESTADLDLGFKAKIGHPEMPEVKEVIFRASKPFQEGYLVGLEEILDMESLISYMAISAYIDNTDGITNNYHLIRTRQHPRLYVMPWDLDLTFRKVVTLKNQSFFQNNALMTRTLEEGSAYRALYEERLVEMHRSLSLEQMGPFLEETQALIRDAWNSDPYLSAGDKSLEEHVGELKERFLAQDHSWPSE